MSQTTLCVPLEVKPESCSRLTALLEELRLREETGARAQPQKYAALGREIPTLHFLSLSVFTGATYDPIFVLEANFDGEPGVFWGQFEAALDEPMRGVLRCCKRPMDEDGSLYDAVTTDGAVPIAPYFEARTQTPSAFHQGNRGLSRDRILKEARLFEAVQLELDQPGTTTPNPYRQLAPVALHAHLRRRMLESHPWLNTPPQKRLPFGERLADLARLLWFAVLLLLALAAPGIVFAAVLDVRLYVALVVVAALALGFVAYLKRKPLGEPGVEDDFNLPGFLAPHSPLIVAFIVAYAVAATVLLTPAVWVAAQALELFHVVRTPEFWTVARAVARSVAWSVPSLAVSAATILVWLRYLERRDSSHDAPAVDERLLNEMIRREDWIVQNHMGSVVLLKPGVLRMLLVRLGHRGLGLLLRFKAVDGFLGSMRTIHFAHWAFLNNSSRLLFVSNFDHSWDSYLDDFIEKAHSGLTMAWSCGVGFPATRFLIYEGATHGRQFKTWALASRTVTRFWYSAYPTLAVNQIERHFRVAKGLHAPVLSNAEAVTWLRDL